MARNITDEDVAAIIAAEALTPMGRLAAALVVSYGQIPSTAFVSNTVFDVPQGGEGHTNANGQAIILQGELRRIIAVDSGNGVGGTDRITIDWPLETNWETLDYLVLAAAVPTMNANGAVTLPSTPPAGYGGGSGLTAQQARDALKLAPSAGTAAAGSIDALLAAASTGTGARTVTVTVNDGTNPIASATVRLTAGVNTYTSPTSALGSATFNVDEGTYTLSITKGGYSYAGSTITVNGDEVATVSMTAIALTPATNPGDCRLYATACDTSTGTPKAGVVWTWRIIAGGTAGYSFNARKRTATSVGTGTNNISLDAPRGATIKVKRGDGEEITVVVPNAATALMADLVGVDDA